MWSKLMERKIAAVVSCMGLIGVHKSGELDRKILADMAMNDAAAFKADILSQVYARTN